jgi:hypothetical protein
LNPPDERKPQKQAPKEDKKARLASKLRANLQRRKAQARSRRDGEADSRPDGLIEGAGDDHKGDG